MFYSETISKNTGSSARSKSFKDGFVKGVPIQPKLTIGKSNDSYELEADRVADKVVGMNHGQINAPSQARALVQRKCTDCENEQGVQTKRNSQGGQEGMASSALTQKIQNTKGNGDTMDRSTRSFMESRFGTDFSNVKIHTDSQAAHMNRELNAQAFTVGNDIYFNEGKYNPTSHQGKHLLAHELTHTLQQGGIQKKSIQRSCHDGKCKSCAGGKKDFWVTFYFRTKATKKVMSKLRKMIKGAQAILAKCCLNLKYKFNWKLVPGNKNVAPFDNKPDGSWNYSKTVTKPGTDKTFKDAKGVPALVVDHVQESGGGVTVSSAFDTKYKGKEYFVLGINQTDPNKNCNHLAHELWHVGSDIVGHDAKNGTLAACTGNGVSAKYCSGLRAMV